MGNNLTLNWKRKRSDNIAGDANEVQEYYEIFEIEGPTRDVKKQKQIWSSEIDELKQKVTQEIQKKYSDLANCTYNKGNIPGSKEQLPRKMEAKEWPKMDSYYYGFLSNEELANMINDMNTVNDDDKIIIKMTEYAVNNEPIKKFFFDNQILIKNSKYFNKFCETQKLEIIKTYGFEPKAVLIVFYCLYSGDLYLNIDNLVEVYKLSNDLKFNFISHLIDKLFDFQDPITWLIRLRSLIGSGLVDSVEYKRLWKDICTQFKSMIEYPGIMELNNEEFKELIAPRDDLFSYLKVMKRSELSIYFAVVDWLQYDTASRKQYTLDLLNRIRFEKMSRSQLKAAFDPHITKDFEESIRSFLYRIQDMFFDKNFNKIMADDNCFQLLPKKTFNIKEVENEIKPEDKPHNRSDGVDGMKNGQIMDTNEMKLKEEQKNRLDKETIDIYRNFSNMAGSFSSKLKGIQDRQKFEIKKEDVTMLLMGGIQSHVQFNANQGLSIHQYKHIAVKDGTTNENSYSAIRKLGWYPTIERLPLPLSHFAIIKYNYLIMIFGGLDLSKVFDRKCGKELYPVNRCFCYNMGNNSWYEMKSMKEHRAYHGAVLVENKIYVFGGLTFKGDDKDAKKKHVETTNSMEVFDLKKNEWSEVKYVGDEKTWPKNRMGFGMLYYKEMIWIIGGLHNVDAKGDYDATKDLISNCHTYNINDNIWNKVESWKLPIPRAFMTANKYKDCLYVIGGIEYIKNKSGAIVDDEATKSVLILKPDGKSWEDGPPLHSARAYHSSSVCEGSLYIIGGRVQRHSSIEVHILANLSGSYELYNPLLCPFWIEKTMCFGVFGASAINLTDNMN